MSAASEGGIRMAFASSINGVSSESVCNYLCHTVWAVYKSLKYKNLALVARPFVSKRKQMEGLLYAFPEAV